MTGVLMFVAAYLIGLEAALAVALFAACPLKREGQARPALRLPAERLTSRRGGLI